MPTLKIIGSGMLGVSQLTLEATDAIRNASQVYWIGQISGLIGLIGNHNISGEDISKLYVDGAEDKENYRAIREHVLVGLSKHNNIALVVPGHPRLGVTIVQEFEKLAKDSQIDLTVYPGISSFDAMINDIGLDPLEEGTCIVDANRLILFNYTMDTVLNYYIYHVCSIGNTKTDYLAPQTRNRVSFLKEKLLQHYSEDHNAVLLSAVTQVGEQPDKILGTVGDLDSLFQKVSFKHSLFIPQITPDRSRINWEFLKLIYPQTAQNA